MVTLKERAVQTIKYAKQTGQQVETTVRTIIPTFVPRTNVKALDVTGLDESEQQTLVNLMEGYAEYVELKSKTIFSFEDWVEQTTGVTPEVKWRTFKLENITESHK